MKTSQVRSGFDEIAERYDREIPKHIREHLCEKKVDYMLRELKKSGTRNPGGMKGLDCGCGTGWHVKRFREKGYDVRGIDVSAAMVKLAVKNNGNADCFLVAPAYEIPFSENSFDFVYFINVLHHMKSREEQNAALAEAQRVLKKGGKLFIQEVNEDTFLFKIYMKYVFPLTNKIHAGERHENYRSLREILDAAGKNWLLAGVKYFTFLPNITPGLFFGALKNFEKFLEKSTKNRLGAHFMITLEKK